MCFKGDFSAFFIVRLKMISEMEKFREFRGIVMGELKFLFWQGETWWKLRRTMNATMTVTSYKY